jgi:hypothetical protein
VHHHLIRKGLRTAVGSCARNRRAARSASFLLLAGYGAEAINPYLAFETLLDMHERGEFPPEVDKDELVYRYIKSVGKGILKVMSKMGISTYQSYCGAQIFDAIGLKSDFVAKYFTGTATTIEGVGIEEVAEETRAVISLRSAMIRCWRQRWKSAANMYSASAARLISGRRMLSPSCSMPCASRIRILLPNIRRW